MTFDQSILNAYEQGLITEETANLFASRKGKVTRGIDIIRKTRGTITTSTRASASISQ
jgi:twitching motility protein PilT